MVKVQATEKFTLKDYNKVEVISKASSKVDEFSKGDIFKCDEATAEYLSGKNPLNMNVIKVLEVIPEAPQEPVNVETKSKLTNKKKKLETKK